MAAPRQTLADRHHGFPHYHCFLSHAGEQKHEVAIPLKAYLRSQHPNMQVFLDEEDMYLGDHSLLRMNVAMDTCDLAVVVVSPEFIRKKYPMRELLTLLQLQREGAVDLLVLLYGGIPSLAALAAMHASYQTPAFWCHDGKTFEVPVDAAELQQWAEALGSLPGACRLVAPDQWETAADRHALVEAEVAELLHARGKLPPRMEVRKNIMTPAWEEMVVRQEEAQQAEAALATHRYVELRGGPGEGKSTLAEYLAHRLCNRWQRFPPDGAVGRQYYALQVDLRDGGLAADGAGLKSVVASCVLAAVGLAVQQTESTLDSDGGGPQEQSLDEKQWLEFMAWAHRCSPCPILLLFENAEDAGDQAEMVAVLRALRTLRHVHIIVATRALDAAGERCELLADAPADCVVDVRPLTTDEGLVLVEACLRTELAAGERKQARKLVEAVQANPLFCSVACRLVQQTSLTWAALLELTKEDMNGVRPPDGRGGGMRRRLTLLQRWLRRALSGEQQQFLAHVAVFAGSFTAAGAAAVQLPPGCASVAAAVEQQLQRLTASDSSVQQQQAQHGQQPANTAAATQPQQKQPLQQQPDQQQDSESTADQTRRQQPVAGEPAEGRQQLVAGEPAEGRQQLVAGEPAEGRQQLVAGEPAEGRQGQGSDTGSSEHLLHKLQALSLLRAAPTGGEPGSYTMGARWLMHALVQQAAAGLLQQASGSSGPGQQAVEQRFARWMLWHPHGPGQVLAGCHLKGDRPDARLTSYLLAVEQPNLQAAVRTLSPELLGVVLSSQQASGDGGEGALERAEDVACDVLVAGGQYAVALQLQRALVAACPPAQSDLWYDLNSNLAATLSHTGRLREARQLYEDLLAALADRFGAQKVRSNLGALSLKSNLANTLQDLGLLEEACQLQEEVLAGREAQLEPGHLDTLSIKNNLANTLKALGQLHRARQLQEDVLAARTSLLGGQHVDTLDTKSNLASTLEAMGELEAAQQLQREVLAAREALLGSQHASTLNIKCNLSITLTSAGRLREAQALQEQVLEAREELLGRHHPDTLITKSSLACTLLHAGQLHQARQMQEQVLAARGEVLGPHHLDTLSAKNNLANTLQALEQPREALPLFEQVAAALEDQLGPRHPNTLGVKNNLASILQELGQLNEAQRLQEEVFAAMLALHGPQHPATLTAKTNLANTLHELGQGDAARQLYEEVLPDMIDKLGPEHPSTLKTKSNLATALHNLGRLSEALQLKEEVLAAVAERLGPCHPTTVQVKCNLANTLQALGRAPEAWQLLMEVAAARQLLEQEQQLAGPHGDA